VSKSCNDYQTWLDRYLRDELDETRRRELRAHLTGCGFCRDALEYHRSLDSQMEAPAQAPGSLRSRIGAKVASASKRPWLERLSGDPTMKRTLISTLGALGALIAVVSLFPGSARASVPPAVKAFRSMKTAVKQTKDVFLYSVDLATVNGHSLARIHREPLREQRLILDGEGAERREALDFIVRDEQVYTITFGPNENVLVLVPKVDPKKRFEVVVDPVSKLPKKSAYYRVTKGKTAKLAEVRFDFKSKRD
jgi:hypothetical protein